MTSIIVTCPHLYQPLDAAPDDVVECGLPIEVDVNVEQDYGADADGRRGRSVAFVEVGSCSRMCNLTLSELEEIEDYAAAQLGED